ncbi:hypothetical protein OAV36_04460 [Flavobacteriales bacterium]|nr:hypothetical protein [Flavobacteriales bacterium]
MDISTDLPIIYSLACLFLGFGYAYFLYRKENLLSSKVLRYSLFIIRTFFIGFLTALLLNPIVKSLQNTSHKPIVIIAQDVSESILDTSSSNFLTNISEQLLDFEVHHFSFSDNVNQGFSVENKGLLTNYSNLFQDMNSRFANQHIAGMILATDGLYNRGNNPLYGNLMNYPIYAIAQGDTTVNKDVSIEKVKQNEIAFLGNTFPLEIAIAAQQCKGENIQVTILHKRKKIYTENVLITTDDDYEKVSVNLLADNVGLQYYTINISQFSDEKNVKNNSYTAYVDVIDSRYKILLLTDGIHPDIAAYKNAIEKNKNYAVEQISIADFDEKLEAYQLVVIFGIKENFSVVKDLKESKIPLLIFNLKQDIHKQFTSVFSFKNRGGLEEVKAVKNESFFNFTFSLDLLNLIDVAPPLYSPFGKYTIKVGAEVMLFQQIEGHTTNNPIIVLDEQNGRKMAIVTAEGFWKWKLYDYSISKNNLAFNELFSKLTQFLVLQGDKSKFRVNYKKQIAENSTIYFDASLYNESYELVNNKEISLIIKNEKGDNFVYEFSKSNSKYNLNAGVLDVGKYTFFAKVKGSEMIKRGGFDVKATQLEQLHIIANHQLLNQLANSSGGKLFYPNQIEEIAAVIAKSKSNFKQIFTEEKLKGIINIPWILLSLLSLISLEWFLRKYNGLI